MKAIDLGLPSGLKWADCNIGAEKETDYGLYFQFGDTIGYGDTSHSTWETCPGNRGDSTYNADSNAEWDAENLNNGVLKPEVDAAHFHLGGNWRMPTLDEIAELYNNTTNEFAEINGVKGRKFISNVDSSKYVFFPFAGYATDNSFGAQGFEGYLWSSSVYPDKPKDAYYFVCADDDVAVFDADDRCDTISIRGVCK